jgi:hypothetical protein
MARSNRRRFRVRWRILTYAIIAFNLLMLAWIIAGPAWVSSACNVPGVTACTGQGNPKRGIAVSVIIAVWALGNLILGGIWIATNNGRRRPCPQCGKQIDDATFRCPRCGHDFHVGLQPRSGRYEPPGGHA